MGCRSNGSSELWAVGITTRTPSKRSNTPGGLRLATPGIVLVVANHSPR